MYSVIHLSFGSRLQLLVELVVCVEPLHSGRQDPGTRRMWV